MVAGYNDRKRRVENEVMAEVVVAQMRLWADRTSFGVPGSRIPGYGLPRSGWR